MPDQHLNTMRLEDAEIHTANWRKYYHYCVMAAKACKEAPPVTAEVPVTDPADGEDIFRGFRISLKDLDQIKDQIDAFNTIAIEKGEKEVNSVRIYLASKNPDPVKTTSDDIHVILVPIQGGAEMENNQSSGDDFGIDLLTINNQSALFDFTTPCPKMCSKISPLYKSAEVK